MRISTLQPGMVWSERRGWLWGGGWPDSVVDGVVCEGDSRGDYYHTVPTRISLAQLAPPLAPPLAILPEGWKATLPDGWTASQISRRRKYFQARCISR